MEFTKAQNLQKIINQKSVSMQDIGNTIFQNIYPSETSIYLFNFQKKLQKI